MIPRWRQRWRMSASGRVQVSTACRPPAIGESVVPGMDPRVEMTVSRRRR